MQDWKPSQTNPKNSPPPDDGQNHKEHQEGGGKTGGEEEEEAILPSPRTATRGGKQKYPNITHNPIPPTETSTGRKEGGKGQTGRGGRRGNRTRITPQTTPSAVLSGATAPQMDQTAIITGLLSHLARQNPTQPHPQQVNPHLAAPLTPGNHHRCRLRRCPITFSYHS